MRIPDAVFHHLGESKSNKLDEEEKLRGTFQRQPPDSFHNLYSG